MSGTLPRRARRGSNFDGGDVEEEGDAGRAGRFQSATRAPADLPRHLLWSGMTLRVIAMVLVGITVPVLAYTALWSNAQDCVATAPATTTASVQSDIILYGINGVNGGIGPLSITLGAIAFATSFWYYVQAAVPPNTQSGGASLARILSNLMYMGIVFVIPLLCMGIISRAGVINSAFVALGCASSSTYYTISGLSIAALACWTVGCGLAAAVIPVRRTVTDPIVSSFGVMLSIIGIVLGVIGASIWLSNLSSISSAVAECASPAVASAFDNLNAGPMSARAACITAVVAIGLCLVHAVLCWWAEERQVTDVVYVMWTPLRISTRLLGAAAYIMLGIAAGWAAVRVKGSSLGALWEASGCTASVMFYDFSVYIMTGGAAALAVGVAMYMDIRCEATFRRGVRVVYGRVSAADRAAGGVYEADEGEEDEGDGGERLRGNLSDPLPRLGGGGARGKDAIPNALSEVGGRGMHSIYSSE